jgi:uncharacterized protein (DUF2249 family)
MNDVVIASSESDAAAATAVEEHHALLSGALALRVEAVLAAASLGDAAGGGVAKGELVRWCETELVPHALAEEKALYPAAQGKAEGRLLVDGMLDEHGIITGLVNEVSRTEDLVRAAASAKALQVLFGSHLAKENELVLPLLVSAADVSVADLLSGMHEVLGGQEHDHEQEHEHRAQENGSACGGHECTCGEVDGVGYPELDARQVPHAIRHATIFGALDAVQPGGGMVLVAPHDPLPLLAQIEARSPEVFTVEYLERGPEAWRLSFARRTS